MKILHWVKNQISKHVCLVFLSGAQLVILFWYSSLVIPLVLWSFGTALWYCLSDILLVLFVLVSCPTRLIISLSLLSTERRGTAMYYVCLVLSVDNIKSKDHLLNCGLCHFIEFAQGLAAFLPWSAPKILTDLVRKYWQILPKNIDRECLRKYLFSKTSTNTAPTTHK